MNLELSTEQFALVESVKSVCEDYFSSEKLHQLSEDFNPDVYEAGWKALSDLGLFSLVQDEDEGGVGLGFVEAALIFEELGRHIVPGPILGSFLHSLISPQDNELKRVEVIHWVDSPVAIPNPQIIDAVMFLDDAVMLQETQSLELESAVPLDPLTPIGKFSKKMDFQEIGDAAMSLKLKTIGCVLVSAFQVGLAEGAMNIAVEYAGQREQFNKPIGSFQAVKHICADMLTLVEVARAGVYVAAITLDDPDSSNLDDNVSVAKVMATKASNFCGQNCVQVHGGIGYTWEADPHLYVKRAWALEQAYGSVGHHSSFLADSMEL